MGKLCIPIQAVATAYRSKVIALSLFARESGGRDQPMVPIPIEL